MNPAVAITIALRGVNGAGIFSSQPACTRWRWVRPPQKFSPMPQPVTTTWSPAFQSAWRLSATVAARSALVMATQACGSVM